MASPNNLQQTKFDIFKPYCQTKKNRGKYNKTPAKKNSTNWEKMQYIYTQLANYCPLPLFESSKEVFDINGLRLWCTNYECNEYTYLTSSGVFENYTGERFKVIEAEISGTENWHIEDRIFLHELLLNDLRSGYDIKSAMEKISPDFNRIKNKYRSSEIVKWLKLHRG